MDENVPAEDTELNFSFSHLNEGKCSTIETEDLSAEVPDASKNFVQTKMLKFSAQFSQAEADRLKSSRAVESGVKEMIKSENEIEEDFKFKLSQAYTKDEGELKGKRKQNLDEIKSDPYRHLEGNEGNFTHILIDIGSIDVPQQIVALTYSEMTNTPLSEPSLSKGPEMDKHEELKHATHLDQTIPDPSENKEDKIGLLWCHSHIELRLIEVEVNLSGISLTSSGD